MKNTILKIREELRMYIDPCYKEGCCRFSKEEIKIYGTRIPVVRKISRKYFSEVKNLDKKEVFNLCERLLKSGYGEETVIAFDWAYRFKNQYQKSDFKIFASWLKKYVSNWGSCDNFCGHTLGYFIFQFSEFIPELKLWAKSKNRWQRRASAVALIYSVRRKKNLKHIFDISNILLQDTDDLVQKGYGWTLKEASNIYPQEVFKGVMDNKNKMPRTALRYAIEKMPREWKDRAMKKN